MKGTTSSLREKEVKAISSIVSSVEKGGDRLYILNKAVTYKNAGSLDELSAVAKELIEKHPHVAFLLTVTEENRFHWLLSISENHPTMGSNRAEIFMKSYNEVVLNRAIYCPEIQGLTETIDNPDFTYFSRIITKNEYVGKIVDAVVSIIFDFLRRNKYIPKVEDEVDELAALDDMMDELEL
jgi:hypothetical protein